MVMSKHLTHFCYPIRQVLHQHLNSHVAYPGIPPENSKHTPKHFFENSKKKFKNINLEGHE